MLFPSVYISPVIANENMVGGIIWKLILLNPLAHVVICFRDVYNATFHATSWLIFTGMSVSAFFIGLIVITRAKVLINEYI